MVEDEAERSRELIDLSHSVEHGMVTYKGLPAPIICDYLSREASRVRYASGTEFQIGKIEMVANTGTYIDSPFHRYANGRDLSELALESLADLDCVVVRAIKRRDRAIDGAALTGDPPGKAVLFHTGWDRHWRTDQYFEGHPYLSARLAEALVAAGAVLRDRLFQHRLHRYWRASGPFNSARGRDSDRGASARTRRFA